MAKITLFKISQPYIKIAFFWFFISVENKLFPGSFIILYKTYKKLIVLVTWKISSVKNQVRIFMVGKAVNRNENLKENKCWIFCSKTSNKDTNAIETQYEAIEENFCFSNMPHTLTLQYLSVLIYRSKTGRIKAKVTVKLFFVIKLWILALESSGYLTKLTKEISYLVRTKIRWMNREIRSFVVGKVVGLWENPEKKLSYLFFL